MKLQLDTEKKTIKLEDEVGLAKLVETLEQLLPHGEWKKFTLEANTTITHWNSPVVIEKYYPRPVQPLLPWYTNCSVTSMSKTPAISYEAGATNVVLKSGIYNVDIKT